MVGVTCEMILEMRVARWFKEKGTHGIKYEIRNT